MWIRRKREHDFASQGAQQTDLREGGREDVEIGGEDGAMVLADDAHLATRDSSIAHEGPHDLVGAGETDWMDAEGAVIVTAADAFAHDRMPADRAVNHVVRLRTLDGGRQHHSLCRQQVLYLGGRYEMLAETLTHRNVKMLRL